MRSKPLDQITEAAMELVMASTKVRWYWTLMEGETVEVDHECSPECKCWKEERAK